jgi:hypothetical protein
METTKAECQNRHPGEASRWLLCDASTRHWNEPNALQEYCVPCFVRVLADDELVDATRRFQEAVFWLELLPRTAGAEGAIGLHLETSQRDLASAQCEALAYLVHGILTAVASGTIDVVSTQGKQQDVGPGRRLRSLPISLLPVLCQITGRALDIHHKILRWCEKPQSAYASSGQKVFRRANPLETIYLIGVAHHCASLFGTWREMRSFLQFFVAVARNRDHAGQPLAPMANGAQFPTTSGPSSAIDPTAWRERLGSVCRDACEALLAYLEHELLLQSSRDRRTAAEAGTSATHALYTMRVLLQALVPPKEPAQTLACCTRIMRLASHRALRCGQPTDLANLLSTLGILLQVLTRAPEQDQNDARSAQWKHTALSPAWSDFLKRCIVQPTSLELNLLALNVFRQMLRVLGSKLEISEPTPESSAEVLSEAEALRLSSLVDYVVECMCRDGAAVEAYRSSVAGSLDASSDGPALWQTEHTTERPSAGKRPRILGAAACDDATANRTNRLAWCLTTSDPNRLRLRSCFRVCAVLPRDEIIGRASLLFALSVHQALGLLGAESVVCWDTNDRDAECSHEARILNEILAVIRRIVVTVGIDGCEPNATLLADLLCALVQNPSARVSNLVGREQRALIEALAESIGACEKSVAAKARSLTQTLPFSEATRCFSGCLLLNMQRLEEASQIRPLLRYIVDCEAWRRLVILVTRISLRGSEHASLAQAFILEYLPRCAFLQMYLDKDGVGDYTDFATGALYTTRTQGEIIPQTNHADSDAACRSRSLQPEEPHDLDDMHQIPIGARIWHWWLTQMWHMLQPLASDAGECHRLIQVAGHPITLWYAANQAAQLGLDATASQRAIDDFLGVLMRHLRGAPNIRYGPLLALVCTDEAVEELLVTPSTTAVSITVLDQALDTLAAMHRLTFNPVDATSRASDLVSWRAQIQLDEVDGRARRILHFLLSIPAGAERLYQRYAESQPSLFDWLDVLLDQASAAPHGDRRCLRPDLRPAPHSVWRHNLIYIWTNWIGSRMPQNITSWLLKHAPTNEWICVSEPREKNPVPCSWRYQALVAAIHRSAMPMVHWREALMNALDGDNRTMFIHLADAWLMQSVVEKSASSSEHQMLLQALLRRGALDWLYTATGEAISLGCERRDHFSPQKTITEEALVHGVVTGDQTLLRVTTELLWAWLRQGQHQLPTDLAPYEIKCWGPIAAHVCRFAAGDAVAPADMLTTLSAMQALLWLARSDSPNLDAVHRLGAYIVHMARAVAHWLRLVAGTGESVQSPLQELILLGCLRFIRALGSIPDAKHGTVRHALRILATAMTTTPRASDPYESPLAFWLPLACRADPRSQKQFLALSTLHVFLRWRILPIQEANDTILLYSLGCWLYMELVDGKASPPCTHAPRAMATTTDKEPLALWFHQESAHTFGALLRALELNCPSTAPNDDDDNNNNNRLQCVHTLALLAASVGIHHPEPAPDHEATCLPLPMGSLWRSACFLSARPSALELTMDGKRSCLGSSP